jgi:hypothetical protein
LGVPANTVWEVRPTVGSDNNGGGFVPGASGTDYSQQTSPQYALTGLTSSGSGNTLLYSGASADMVGNVAQAISGSNLSLGMFEIVSVSVGVSITFGTNEQGSSIALGTVSSGVVNIGGALATLAILGRVIESYTQVINGNVIYIKATGSLTMTAELQNYDVNFFTVIGYTTTRGDGGQAIITTATNSTSLYNPQNNNFSSIWVNINFTNTAATPSTGLNVPGGTPVQAYVFVNCTFNGFTVGANLSGSQIYRAIFISCEIKNCTTAGIQCDYPIFMEIDNCYIHDNAIGVTTNPNGNSTFGTQTTITRTTFYNNTTYGFIAFAGASGNNNIGSFVSCWNCNFVNNGSDGFNNVGNDSAGQGACFFNCIFVGNGGYGINVGTAGDNGGSGPVQFGHTNAFYNNASGARHNYPTFPDDITLTGVPFNNIPTDWTLNNVTGEGASCRGVGFPTSVS